MIARAGITIAAVRSGKAMAGAVLAGSGIPADARAIRIIVTCELAVCSEAGAAFRLDSVDATGKTTSVGRGSWGNAVQP